MGDALRLKTIEIIGFKSFADKIALEFNAGITGIVGPNGCGKSNIADAFRWVLGEQSAKSMRGSKMPDVIFAGTTTRKPLNFAEVTITLGDIQENELPIEYAEVSVTRRLHRSGESDYFINRHPVRLKDVQSLFLDSGMGKDAYSIFEQGKIDQVINFSPLERRYIFEEAAGILRFLQRKREALRKLEQSDQNILRVKDIHQEVEKQIIILEQQAEKARLYKESKANLEMLEKGLYVAKWDLFQKKRDDTLRKEEAHKKQIGASQQTLEGMLSEMQRAKGALEEAEKELKVRSEEVYRTRSDKEIKTREKQSYQERLKECITKEKKWQHELESMQGKRKERQIERQSLLKQHKQVEKELGMLEKSAQMQRTKVQALEEEVGLLRVKQQKAQTELLTLLKTENQFGSDLKQNSVRLENNQERQQQQIDRREKLGSILKGLEADIKEKKLAVKLASEAVDSQKEVFVSLEKQLQEIGDELQKHQAELDAVSNEIAEGKARQKALNRLREDLEGFTSGSKKLLQEAGNSKSPLYNKLKGLYEYLSPKTGGEQALAAIMRPYAQTLVAETAEDLELAIQFASKHKLKDYSLLCLQHLKKAEKLKIKGTLLDRMADHPLAKHFLGHVLLASDKETAFQMIEGNQAGDVWLEEGILIDRNRVMFSTAQGENNVFLREAELKSLAKKLEEKEQQRLSIEGRLKSLQQRRSQIQTERVELDKAIRRAEMKQIEVNFALQRLNGDQDKSQNEHRQIEEDLFSLKKVMEQLTELIAELNQHHAEAKTKASEVQKHASTTNSELEQKEAVLKHELRDLQEKEASNQKMAEENRRLAHALNVLDVKDLESEQQEQRLKEEIEAIRELQAQMKSKGSDYEQALEKVEKILNEVTDSCADLEKNVAQKKKGIEEIDNKINQLRNRQQNQEKEAYQMSVQLAQNDASRESLEAEIRERYNMTLQEARQQGLGLDKTVEQTEKMIRSLRQEMDAAGDINMTSIEEFDKHKTRYEFLNQQIDDLNVSKQELVQIIAQLDGESRKIFKETFEVIKANFQKNFKILFSGGEADLQFTETSDVLEAGIEIIAKPPGKQMRSINLLSGGEKCLTAMALLFAIFEVKPAPFCILDEIDAPLDDTNVERFVNVVKQFIDRCQFIIITHNKRTMAIADVLFGVSMEERGVSKILSLEFEAATV